MEIMLATFSSRNPTCGNLRSQGYHSRWITAADGVEGIIYAAAPTVHKHTAASANADWQVPALWQGWRRRCIIADDELVPVRTGWWEGIANVRSDEVERREQ